MLISIYRLEDELWHVNKINSFGHGSHRDYRPKWPSASHIGHFTPETKPKHSRKLDNSKDSRSCQPSPMLWFRRNMGVVLVIEILHLSSVTVTCQDGDEENPGAGLSTTSSHAEPCSTSAGPNPGALTAFELDRGDDDQALVTR